MKTFTIAFILVAAFCFPSLAQTPKETAHDKGVQAVKLEDEGKFESNFDLRRESRAKNQESRVKNQESRAKKQEPRIKNQEPRVRSQESRIKSQETRAKNQESRAKSQESRIKNQEPRIKIKSQESRQISF